MCNLCDARKAASSAPLFGEGVQYRTSPLGYWKDVETDQKSFNVYSVSTIEFRKKPKMVATITYDSNSAIFYDEDSLHKAIEINLKNGTAFELDVEFK